MRRTLSMVLVVAALGAGAVPARAHHAFSAEFDVKKPVKFRGILTKMEWVNPHGWLHIDVMGEDGKIVKWMIETAAPNALLRRGFTKNSLPAGTEILVEGFQAKNGTNKANGSSLTLADGKRLFLRAETDPITR